MFRAATHDHGHHGHGNLHHLRPHLSDVGLADDASHGCHHRRRLLRNHRVLLRETTGQVGLIEHITDHVLRRNKSVLRAGRDHDVEGLVHLRHQRCRSSDRKRRVRFRLNRHSIGTIEDNRIVDVGVLLWKVHFLC